MDRVYRSWARGRDVLEEILGDVSVAENEVPGFEGKEFSKIFVLIKLIRLNAKIDFIIER